MIDCREQYGVTDPVRELGPAPKIVELGQRRRWQELRQRADRGL
jgi:hypothetical protein